MADSFDPYSEWLGIAGTERPPNHYRLLGLEPFETDAEAIGRAAVAVMAKVRRIRSGPHLADWSRILDELAAAKACLLDPAQKAAYDAALRTGESKTEADDDLKLDPIQPFSRFKNMPAAPNAVPAPSKNEEDLGFKDDPFDRRPARKISQAEEDADAITGYDVKSPGGSGSGPAMRGKMAYRPVSDSGGGYALQTDRQPPPAVKERRRRKQSWKGPIVVGVLLLALGIGAAVFNNALQESGSNAWKMVTGGPSNPSPQTSLPRGGGRPPQPGAPAAPPRPANFAEAAAAAREAFTQRKLSSAKGFIQEATAAARTQAERDRAERLGLMLDYLTQFWKGIGDSMDRYLPGRPIMYDNNARMTLLEVGRNYWKVQEGDGVREYQALTLPSSVVWMIVQDFFGRDPGSKAVIAAFMAVDPKCNLEEAKAYWREAGEAGIDSASLIREFEEYPPAR